MLKGTESEVKVLLHNACSSHDIFTAYVQSYLILHGMAVDHDGLEHFRRSLDSCGWRLQELLLQDDGWRIDPSYNQSTLLPSKGDAEEKVGEELPTASLESLSVNSLRSMLKKEGLVVYGRKEELIRRIVTHAKSKVRRI
jgi:hypothetical protein